METRQIDVIYRVRESEKFYVESINVEGNTKSKSRVIIRELASPLVIYLTSDAWMSASDVLKILVSLMMYV